MKSYINTDAHYLAEDAIWILRDISYYTKEGGASRKWIKQRIDDAKSKLAEAELLLQTDTGATHGNTPLRKHHDG